MKKTKLKRTRKKVIALLLEIKDLQRKKNELDLEFNSCSDNELYLLAEIFRKFAVIDVIIKSTDIKDSHLKDIISAAKMETKAGSRSWKKMPIPKLKNKRIHQCQLTNEQKYFPSYFKLPPEIREMILEKLTLPSDKLNLVKEIPFEGDMMKWNETILQLNLIAPILIRSKLLPNSDLINLIVSCSCDDNVLKYFQDRHDNQNFQFTPYFSSNDFDWLTEEDICILDSFPIKLDVNLENDYDDEICAQTKVPANLYNQISSAKIQANCIPSNRKNQKIRDWLNRLPNLKHLHINFYNFYEMPQTVDTTPLPYLPNLKFLKLKNCFLGNDPILESFVKTHQFGLKGLSILDQDLYSLPKLVCPQLIKLEFMYYVRDFNERKFTGNLLSFVGSSPLKSIQVIISERYLYRFDDDDNEDDSYQEIFPSVMKHLVKFRDTLENLAMLILPFQDLKKKKPDDSWILDLDFPRLKLLYLGVNPGNWGFILQFPALETLQIDMRFWGSNDLSCRSQFILDLTGRKESIRKSGIWKMLTNLKEIEVKDRWGQIYGVGRSECVDDLF